MAEEKEFNLNLKKPGLLQTDSDEELLEIAAKRSNSLGGPSRHSSARESHSGEEFSSPTNSAYQRTTGLRQILHPVYHAAKLGVDKSATQKAKDKARREVSRINDRAVAATVGKLDHLQLKGDLDEIKRTQQDIQKEMRDRSVKSENNLNDLFEKRFLLLQQQLKATQGELNQSVSNFNAGLSPMEVKLSPVVPNTSYATEPAHGEAVGRAEKALMTYVNTTKQIPGALYKNDATILDFLQQLNIKAYEFALTEEQTKQLLAKTLPQDSPVLTAVQSLGDAPLASIYNRLTCINPAVENLDSLQRRLDKWFIRDSRRFGDAFDDLESIHKRLHQKKFDDLKTGNPNAIRNWYNMLFTKILDQTQGTLRNKIAKLIQVIALHPDTNIHRVCIDVVAKLGVEIENHEEDIKKPEKRNQLSQRNIRLINAETPNTSINSEVNYPKPQYNEWEELDQLWVDKDLDAAENACYLINTHQIPKGKREQIIGKPRKGSYVELMKFHWEDAGEPIAFRDRGAEWIKPYPEDDPEFPEFAPGMGRKQLSKEIIRYWLGYCIRCGSGRHQGDQCYRYSDAADTFDICRICRQGFHQSCFSPRQSLKQKLVEVYGPGRIDEIKGKSYEYQRNPYQQPARNGASYGLNQHYENNQTYGNSYGTSNPSSMNSRPEHQYPPREYRNWNRPNENGYRNGNQKELEYKPNFRPPTETPPQNKLTNAQEVKLAQLDLLDTARLETILDEWRADQKKLKNKEKNLRKKILTKAMIETKKDSDNEEFEDNRYSQDVEEHSANTQSFVHPNSMNYGPGQFPTPHHPGHPLPYGQQFPMPYMYAPHPMQPYYGPQGSNGLFPYTEPNTSKKADSNSIPALTNDNTTKIKSEN